MRWEQGRNAIEGMIARGELERGRNQAEYPVADQPRFSSADVQRDLPKVQQIVDAAEKVLDEMSPF